MEVLETKFLDRSGWDSGPWDGEPDRVEWKDGEFTCLLRRGGQGAWCGYVAVPQGHPWFEKTESDLDLQVHGGVTYAEHCSSNLVDGQERGICHAGDDGAPVWWVGFDCIHSGDLGPASRPMLLRRFGEAYRTKDYATAEVNKLVRQARGAVQA